MDLCHGTTREAHVPIVHEEGWRHCPVCQLQRKVEELLNRLEEANLARAIADEESA